MKAVLPSSRPISIIVLFGVRYRGSAIGSSCSMTLLYLAVVGPQKSALFSISCGVSRRLIICMAGVKHASDLGAPPRRLRRSGPQARSRYAAMDQQGPSWGSSSGPQLRVQYTPLMPSARAEQVQRRRSAGAEKVQSTRPCRIAPPRSGAPGLTAGSVGGLAGGLAGGLLHGQGDAILRDA